MLPRDRIPEGDKIINLPHYDKTREDEIGELFFFGFDSAGNEVYILGMAGGEGVITPAIRDFLKLIRVPAKDVLIIRTLPLVNVWTRIGGFMSRKLGLVFPGRPLTIWSLQQNYFQFVKLVEEVEGRIASTRTGRN